MRIFKDNVNNNNSTKNHLSLEMWDSSYQFRHRLYSDITLFTFCILYFVRVFIFYVDIVVSYKSVVHELDARWQIIAHTVRYSRQ